MPQKAVISPSLFTTDFCYNSGKCQMPKFSDETANVASRGVRRENTGALCRTLWSEVGRIISIAQFISASLSAHLVWTGCLSQKQRRWCWTLCLLICEKQLDIPLPDRKATFSFSMGSTSIALVSSFLLKPERRK